ncbi:MAG: TRAP transporter substrate-binding protein [Pseudomonadota bacterium]
MAFSRFTLASTLALGVCLSAPAALADQLTVASFVPPQHHTNSVMFAWLAEELDARSGGDLTLQVFPAGQLGAGPVQQYRRVVEGVADITFGVSAYTPTVFPRTMLAILPGEAETSAEATQRILAIYDDYLAEEYEDVVMLGLATAPGIGIASTVDLSTMEAFQGAKVVPYAALTTPLIEAMGAVPVQMPVTEMYTGLSTGTIDATYATYNNMTPPWNFWDVADYFVENVPVQHAVVFVLMNRERYEGLSPEHRAIIDELRGEAISMQIAASFDGADQRSLEMMEAQDPATFERVRMSDDERALVDAALMDGFEAVFADYESRGIENAREIYEALNQ